MHLKNSVVPAVTGFWSAHIMSDIQAVTQSCDNCTLYCTDVEPVSAQSSDSSSNSEVAMIMIQSVQCNLHDLTAHTPT